MEVTQEDIADILEAFAASGFGRLALTDGAVQLVVHQGSAADAVVSAPLLGIFESGEPAFVQPGSEVEPETPIGIIRVLQDRTTVRAGMAGTVVDVLVRDGQFIEYGQALLRVKTR